MVFYIVEKAEDFPAKFDLLNSILKLPYTLLSKSPNKIVQSGGALILSKIVQNSSEEITE